MRILRKLIKMNDKKHKRKMKELKKILEGPVPKGYVPYVESEPNSTPKSGNVVEQMMLNGDVSKGDVSKPKNGNVVEQMMLNGDDSKPKSGVNKSNNGLSKPKNGVNKPNNGLNNLAKSFGKVSV